MSPSAPLTTLSPSRSPGDTPVGGEWILTFGHSVIALETEFDQCGSGLGLGVVPRSAFNACPEAGWRELCRFAVQDCLVLRVLCSCRLQLLIRSSGQTPVHALPSWFRSVHCCIIPMCRCGNRSIWCSASNCQIVKPHL